MERAFVQDAIQGDLAEIQIGQLAEQNGSSAATKQFGQTLVTDHTANLQQAEALAQSLGIAAPSQPNAEQRAMLQQLSGLSGSQFDVQFARDMVVDHVKEIVQFAFEAWKADPVGDFARQSLPVLERHLQSAESLAASGGTSSAATSDSNSASGTSEAGTNTAGAGGTTMGATGTNTSGGASGAADSPGVGGNAAGAGITTGETMIMGAGDGTSGATGTSGTSTNTAGGGGTPTGETSTENAKVDAAFLREAIRGDLAEIQVGQLAEQNGGSEQTKQFGQTLVADHTANLQEAEALAQSMGIAVPSQPDAEQRATLQELSRLSGAQFDTHFARDMVVDHVKEIVQFAFVGQENDPVGAFARQSLPVLEQHLQVAESLAASGGSSSGSSTSSSGSAGTSDTGTNDAGSGGTTTSPTASTGIAGAAGGNSGASGTGANETSSSGTTVSTGGSSGSPIPIRTADVCGSLEHLGFLQRGLAGENPDSAFPQRLWSSEVRSVLSGSGSLVPSQVSNQRGAATDQTQNSTVGAATNSLDGTSHTMPITQLQHS
ncbi:DUF4142 domain-containing protein [Bradyrhizobium sp. STM 3557]|uniref:DUF4142 domain-containing protein n=1 Tax=Bradyrhizobium sp. STM 3557 TaxID=578920 RepID=UPI00388DBAEE